MSDELRREAADLVRAVRRRVERERALGTGELLATGVARARKVRGPAFEPAVGFTAPVAVEPTPAPPRAKPAAVAPTPVVTAPAAPSSEPPAFLKGLPETAPAAAAPKDDVPANPIAYSPESIAIAFRSACGVVPLTATPMTRTRCICTCGSIVS